MSQRVTFAQLPGMLQARLEAQHRSVVQVTHEAAQMGLLRIDQSIVQSEPHKPVDQGFYRASHQVDLDNHGATIGSDAPYAAVIEYGARPFMPPIDALYRWAYRKFRVQLVRQYRVERSKGNRSRAGQEGYRQLQAENIAWAVARKIARKGIAPRHVYARALPAMRRDLGRLLRTLRSRPGFAR